MINEYYGRIQRKLCEEVKNYIDDVIINEWVKKENLTNTSPMVCVREKDGSLHLCTDYRKLNNKTIPEKQPIPKVRDILDNLGGSSASLPSI